jgi:hypothetical protein
MPVKTSLKNLNKTFVIVNIQTQMSWRSLNKQRKHVIVLEAQGVVD